MMHGLGIKAAAEYFNTSEKVTGDNYWRHSLHHQKRGAEAVERKQ
jgi:hypothetical protein